MKYYTLLFIGTIILSIILLILSLFFGVFFPIFPFFIIIPLSCGLKRRAEEYSAEESRAYDNPSTEDIKLSDDINQKVLTMCPMCNKKISEENLRFCPHCGSKIQNSKG
ncbi:MAG: hypothetical protein ACFE78_06925 [Candidatus Hodarchaeota archaeon]